MPPGLGPMLPSLLARSARVATGPWSLAEAALGALAATAASPGPRRAPRGLFQKELYHAKPRLLVARGLSSSAAPSSRVIWHEQQNAQGRVYYLNTATGARSWDRPGPEEAIVKSLAELEAEAEEKANEEDETAASASSKPYQGDSLMMRAVDNFWKLVDLARRTYWLGIVVGAVYVLSELYKDFAA